MMTQPKALMMSLRARQKPNQNDDDDDDDVLKKTADDDLPARAPKVCRLSRKRWLSPPELGPNKISCGHTPGF